jgi:tRNA modification GTPase
MNDTIIALATPQGSGAIAVIRLSGSKAIDMVDNVFYHKQKLIHIESQKQVFGTIKYGDDVIDGRGLCRNFMSWFSVYYQIYF